MPATGSYSQAYRHEFFSVRRRIGTAVVSFVGHGRLGAHVAVTFVHTFQHWQFFLCACGAVGRQYGVGLAAGGSSDGRMGVSCRRSSRKLTWCCRQDSKVLVSCRQSSQRSIGLLQAGSKVLVQLQVKAVKVYLGSSTVLAAVVIVVKHRACLLVGRLIVGV